MATEARTALDSCRECIDAHRSFVLQGGAGSGKTESLKDLLLYIKHSYPISNVVCITHTNAAADEIMSRVGDQYLISTIHSFLYSLIGDYKKNIKTVISELFYVSPMVRATLEPDASEADYKKAEYQRYKKVYEKYANKLYAICREDCEKAATKREYDKDPIAYNKRLNDKIQVLNVKIGELIEPKDYSGIHYNETKFNNLSDLSYGHDGLLSIFHLLFTNFPLLGKIISDKYDYIFIDEYQDTRAEILCDILQLSTKYGLTVGLFGDDMQSIYSDGVGNIDPYIQGNTLVKIPKPDNYRCSYEVIDFINPLRLDKLSQDVALKKISNEEYEAESDRRGNVTVLYTVTDIKPTAYSPPDEKSQFQSLINQLISEAQKRVQNSKVLILTNKAIAEKNGFKELYRVFDDRYVDVSDRIENYLRSIQALDISDLCSLYLKHDYNGVIKQVRKSGYVIHNISDKRKLHDTIQGIINGKNFSIYEIIEIAISNKLIKRTETYSKIIERNAHFLEQLKADELYQKFRVLFLSGQNTYNRIKGSINFTSEEEFDYFVSRWKRERFITELFSPKLKFSEVINYTKYLNEETEYITMHKTKGSSIPSVIVVMEEYFWNEYDFSLLYKLDEQKIGKKINSQKLIYVACSRARKDLVCIRVLERSEVELFIQKFPQAEEVVFPSTPQSSGS